MCMYARDARMLAWLGPRRGRTVAEMFADLLNACAVCLCVCSQHTQTTFFVCAQLNTPAKTLQLDWIGYQ